MLTLSMMASHIMATLQRLASLVVNSVAPRNMEGVLGLRTLAVCAEAGAATLLLALRERLEVAVLT